MRYVFGERDMEPLKLERDVANPANPGADLASDIHDVVARDWSVIGGYFLVLFTCALIFMVIMLAFSNSARNLSFAIFGAVIVATVMDIAENVLVLLSTNLPGFPDAPQRRAAKMAGRTVTRRLRLHQLGLRRRVHIGRETNGDPRDGRGRSGGGRRRPNAHPR